ncbi:hypothetical protein [Stenotrophomonas maltophilia]|uniref:hypothetical protein n=1 Tax=Stenotrophomonas maltophilia TaxID=40324 RepID=UPI0015F21AE9|nr:hypothetical protein [Stenotrophomonas maltophilia]QDY50439.1 hypothetical protein DUW70_18910 [Stenotrophomonas maltophilia]
MSRYVKSKGDSPVTYRDTTIDRAVVERFLKEKTQERPCYECGSDLWRLMVSPGKEQQLAITTVAPDDDDETHYMAVLMCTCDNCGNSKFFTLRAVRIWLRQQEKNEEEKGTSSRRSELDHSDDE